MLLKLCSQKWVLMMIKIDQCIRVIKEIEDNLWELDCETMSFLIHVEIEQHKGVHSKDVEIVSGSEYSFC